MATQNVFVTKTENRFLPIIQAFTDNLYKNIAMQNQLADRTMAFNKQVGMQSFGSNLNASFEKVKTPEELNSLVGQAYSQALSKGYTELIPMINSYAQVRGKNIELAKEQKTAQTLLNSLDPEEERFIGNQLMKVKDIRLKYGQEFQDDATLYSFLTALPAPKVESSIFLNPETGSTEFNRGYFDSKGQWHKTEDGQVTTYKGKTYLEKGGAVGLQEGIDRELTPIEMAQWSKAASELKRQQMDEKRLSLSQRQLELSDRERLTVSDIKTYRAWNYQDVLSLGKSAAADEHLRWEDNYIKSKGEDYKKEEDEDFDFLSETKKEQINKKYSNINDLDVIKRLNKDYYNANKGVFESLKNEQLFNEELTIAAEKGTDFMNQYRSRRNEIITKLNPDEEALWMVMEPPQKVSFIENKMRKK